MKSSIKLNDYAKQLRHNQTTAEERLWDYLRARRMVSLKFKRQFVIDNFIVDFYCAKAKTAIEIDGDEHYTKEHQEYDAYRSETLKAKGINILRYTNREVMCEIDRVIEDILNHLREY